MKQVDAFLKWATITACAIFGILYGYLQNVFSTSPLRTVSYLAVGFIVLVILLRLSETLILNLINYSGAVRKLLFGKEFIEGYWFEQATNPSQKVVKVACVLISFRNGTLRLSGSTFEVDTTRMHTFNSTFTQYENFNLLYEWDSHIPFALTQNDLPPTNEQVGRLTGYGSIKFAEALTRPQTYTGNYFSTSEKAVLFSVTGNLITSSKDIEKLEKPDGRKEFLRLKARQLKKR